MLAEEGVRARSALAIAMRSAKVPILSLSGLAYTSSPGLNVRTRGPTAATTPAGRYRGSAAASTAGSA